MKAYRTRPGVVQTSVCGEYLLVAAGEARRFCPYVSVINETSAFLWQQMLKGADRETLTEAVQREYEVQDPEMARREIDGFLNQMLELGYLLPTEQGGEHEA